MAWSEIRKVSSHAHPSFEGFFIRDEVQAPDSLKAPKLRTCSGNVRTVVEKGGRRVNMQGSLTGTWHSGGLHSDQEFRRIPGFHPPLHLKQVLI